MKTQYLTPTKLYQEARRRQQELITVQGMLEKRLQSYPKGKIHIAPKASRVQYYLRTDAKDRTGVYLSQKDKGKIAVFLQKKYDEAAIKKIEAEIQILEYFLKKDDCRVRTLQNIYSAYPREIKDQIIPIDMSDEDYIRAWMKISYSHKPISEELPVYITNNGEHVRSKSELHIANTLQKWKIPYKYECPITLSNGKKIHPDFTLLDMSRRCEVYWEHRGMMDDREYAKLAVQRVKEYGKEGILPGDRLLLTEETANLPLGTNEIENIIRFFMKKAGYV